MSKIFKFNATVQVREWEQEINLGVMSLTTTDEDGEGRARCFMHVARKVIKEYGECRTVRLDFLP